MDANNLAKWEELKLAHLQLRLSSFLCDLAGVSLVWKKTKTNQMRPSNCYLSRACCSKGVSHQNVCFRRDSKQIDTWETLQWGKGNVLYIS